MIRYVLFVLVLLNLTGNTISAKVRVVTSIPDFKDLVEQIGKDLVEVQSIARGTEDPHFIEVLPSYMVKIRRADLFLMVGLELDRWALQLIDGARNSNLRIIDCSQGISVLEVPTRKVDASMGDIHRFGNSHYWLNPENVPVICRTIVNGLINIDPENSESYLTNMEEYAGLVEGHIRDWKERLEAVKGKRVIEYHKSWVYFADFAGLYLVDSVEPQPGVPPTPSHLAALIKVIPRESISMIIVAPYFRKDTAEMLSRTTQVPYVIMPTMVGGVKEAKTYIEMMEFNVWQITTHSL